ncbi:hypothetical protein [Rhizobium metallidurans]|uniref:Transposase n=1 Tax=Rhizobium metallidurans TaxID=1265931 RepID=A0A7W6CR99_9HYPH|nr:hypothetical protein [Rhizobium metallidurans]MBB3965762.1 hypothetical protein [Rhizobium metallidurans]
MKEIARTKGVLHDAAAVGRLTVLVARLFNKGLRERDELLSAAMESYSALAMPSLQASE